MALLHASWETLVITIQGVLKATLRLPTPLPNSKLQPTKFDVSLFIYFYRRSTCFRRFLRPSSGAHNFTYSFRYCQPIMLLAAIVDEMELLSISSTKAAGRIIG